MKETHSITFWLNNIQLIATDNPALRELGPA